MTVGSGLPALSYCSDAETGHQEVDGYIKYFITEKVALFCDCSFYNLRMTTHEFTKVTCLNCFRTNGEIIVVLFLIYN